MLAKGICDAGADVFEIGLAGTEEVYSSVLELNACGGIEVTASHNPINYNGMKIVGRGSQPLSVKEFGFIKDLAKENNFSRSQKTGVVFDKKRVARAAYVEKVLGFVDCVSLKPSKLSLIPQRCCWPHYRRDQ